MAVTVATKTASDQFLAELIQQANQQVGTVLKAEVQPVEFSGTGDFRWYFQNDKGFNQATFNQISQRVQRSQRIQNGLQLIDAFPNLYIQVLKGIEFTLSQADQEKLNAAELKAAVQGASLVTQWEQTFEPITDEMMKAVKANTKLNYIIYTIRTEWAPEGKPVSWDQLKKARNMADLLPNTPPSGETILPLVTLYLNALGDATTLAALRDNGNWTLTQLVNNTATPAAENGGMKYVDPSSGVAPADKFLPRYNMGKDIPQIQGYLTGNSKITITMEVTKTATGEFQLKINGQVGASFGSFIQVSGQHISDFELVNKTAQFDKVTVTMVYPGVAPVPFAPMLWNQATNEGWFYALPIAEAVKNLGQDVTGFKFVAGKPTGIDFTAGAAANFGMLQGLVVCNYPTIRMEYEHADYKYFSEVFTTETQVGVKLFGFIPIGSVKERSYSSKVTQEQSTGKVIVEFVPPNQSTSVPPLDQTAYLIGGAVTFPVADALK